MKEADLNLLKEKLENNLTQINHDIVELKEMVKPIAPENAIGRISRMDAINNKSVNEAALRKAKIKQVAIEDALSRINQADFGICLRCGKAIPLGRLVLRPQSKSCVSCAH